MRYMKPALLFVIVLLMAQAAASQRAYFGKIVEVIDGKTFVIDLPTGRVTGVLPYIEVPEPDQALHQTVREHIGQLVTGKYAELRVVAMGADRLSGKLFINGIDISQQMLRDGAAWLMPMEMSGQPSAEYASYKSIESQAKAERRGVWGMVGLKPAWEWRAEKLERETREKQKLQAKMQATAAPSAAKPQYVTNSNDPAPGRPGRSPLPQSAAADMDAWADVYAGVGRESAGLLTHFDKQRNISVIATSNSFVNLASGNERHRLECRAFFGTRDLGGGSTDSIFLIGFRSISPDFQFSKMKSRLTVVADKQAIALGEPRGFLGQDFVGAHEIFYYKVSRQSMIKIANAKTLELKIDRFAGSLTSDSQALIKQLIDAAK
jgi:endonuclease YncB( thermonuclease family)